MGIANKTSLPSTEPQGLVPPQASTKARTRWQQEPSTNKEQSEESPGEDTSLSTSDANYVGTFSYFKLKFFKLPRMEK